MNHARKMVLVPEQTMERLQQRQKINTAPLTSRLNSLNGYMQHVLENEDMTNEEKVRNYVNEFQNYLTYYNKRKDGAVPVTMKTKPVLPKETVKEAIENPEVEEDKIEQEILRSLPKNLKNRGKLLIDKIKENPEIMKWDDQGRLTVANQPVAGTHVVDLVSDFLKTRK